MGQPAGLLHVNLPIVRGPKAILGVNLALGSILLLFLYIAISIAPESTDSKSAGCQAATLGEIELFTF